MIELSAPQGIYLNGMKSKYRAYVGGFGCMHPNTLVHTAGGFKRICDITEPTQVLSWNEIDCKFQLSLSGGSFPKGKANLYRVTTQQGEFVASGHHRILSSGGSYLMVEGLRVGDEVETFCQYQPDSSSESDQLSSILDVQHYSQIDEDYLRDYADAARLCGLLLHPEASSALSSFPLSDDARKSRLYADLLSIAHMDDQLELIQEHIHRDLFSVLQRRNHLAHQLRSLSRGVVSQISALHAEHIYDCHQQSQQSVLMSASHRNAELSSPAYRSYDKSSTETSIIISIVDTGVEELYYDMQVLDTNNYVTSDGCIHHNSGKTFVGCLDNLTFAAKHPGTRQGYFGPTYGAIRDIFYPTYDEAAELLGFTTKVNVGNKEVHLYRNGFYYGTTICRSMDNPSSIVGFKIARALTDELDVLPRDKANTAWNKIAARMRLKIDGVVNSIGVTTTPEGFKFVYDKFKNEPTKSYSMVQASTHENAKFLPDDYISSLEETYPSQLINAYLNGEFVNLTSGSVYYAYDRKRCRSYEDIKPGEPIFIGQDFNVGKMASTIYVQRGKIWHAVMQLKDLFDTPDVIRVVTERWKNNGHRIVIYPDASGKNRKSNQASTSDIAMLQQAGFDVRVNPSNPAVKDRVLSVNVALEKGLLMVNDKNCPDVARVLEQQAYDDNGEPEKDGKIDHMADALGYPIAYEMPILKPVINIPVRFAL